MAHWRTMVQSENLGAADLWDEPNRPSDPRPVPLHDQAILARAYLSLTEGGTTLAATGAGSNNLDLRSHTNRRHAP